MASVFIAGHGRMRRRGSVSVPAGVSIAWAVPPTYNGSGGLSAAFLSGAYDTWAGHTNAGEPYYDHYLCPDGAQVMSNKAVALSQGNRTPRGEIYLLQPRLKFTTTLSSIVLFLKRRLPGPLQIYWTCCRSPIGEPASRIRLFENGNIKDEPADGNIVADPDEVFSSPKISAKKVDQLLNKRDFMKRWTENPVVVNGIDGGVTLKAVTAAGFELQTTWPGVDQVTVNKGRGRSNSALGRIKD